MRKPALDRKTLCLSVAVALAATLAAPAHAQQPAATAEDEAETLDAITVTAQKREEGLQDVPVTLTALPERLLRDTGVRDIKDMQVLVPGLTVTSTQTEAQTTARIRGIGTVGDNAGLESSVGVVIDGVYRPRNGVGFGDLGEIDRIEDYCSTDVAATLMLYAHQRAMETGDPLTHASLITQFVRWAQQDGRKCLRPFTDFPDLSKLLPISLLGQIAAAEEVAAMNSEWRDKKALDASFNEAVSY